MLAPPVGDGLLEANVEPRQIVRVDSRPPIGAPGLHRSLGQAVDGCVARRNLDGPRGNVVREASDQGDLSGERQLRVALGKCLLCLLARADVDRHVHDADDRTGPIPHRRGIGNNGNASAVGPLQNRLLAAHGPALFQGDLGRAIFLLHRRAVGTCVQRVVTRVAELEDVVAVSVHCRIDTRNRRSATIFEDQGVVAVATVHY